MSLNFYPGEICTSVYLYRIQKNDKDSCCNCNNINKKYLTLGGPIIIPVQCVRVMSSSFSRPQLIVPSPTPFWPCSSSSKRRKFRGTTETRFITVLFTIASFIVTAETNIPARPIRAPITRLWIEAGIKHA